MEWLKEALEKDVFPTLVAQGFRCEAKYWPGGKDGGAQLNVDILGGSNQSPFGFRTTYEQVDASGQAAKFCQGLFHDPRRSSFHPRNQFLLALADLRSTYNRINELAGTADGRDAGVCDMLEAIHPRGAWAKRFARGCIEPEQAQQVLSMATGDFATLVRDPIARTLALQYLEKAEGLHVAVHQAEPTGWELAAFVTSPLGLSKLTYLNPGDHSYRLEAAVMNDGQLRKLEFVQQHGEQYRHSFPREQGTTLAQALEQANDWVCNDGVDAVKRAQFADLKARVKPELFVLGATDQELKLRISSPKAEVLVTVLHDHGANGRLKEDPAAVLKGLIRREGATMAQTLHAYVSELCELVMAEAKEVRGRMGGASITREGGTSVSGNWLLGFEQESFKVPSVFDHGLRAQRLAAPQALQERIFRMQLDAPGRPERLQRAELLGVAELDPSLVTGVLVHQEQSRFLAQEKALAKTAKKQRGTGR
ncbi:hypothetical protein GCM10028813_01080 [Ramlibacter alkalitolerans]